MHRLRTYESPITAWHAAVQLWRQGIAAKIYRPPADPFSVGGDILGSRYEILLADRSQRGRAERILDEAPPWSNEVDEDWESAAASPDLSRLDPALHPPCPACRHALPLRADVTRCPACGGPVDVIEELVTRHGPEALAACYPEPAELFDDATLVAAAIPCPNCEYPLDGLPTRGRCPECGVPYDKRAIVHSWLT